MILSRSRRNTIKRLLGKGILPKHINDDVLGRTLDKIHEHGCTELFNKIVLKAIKNVPLDKHILHNDTTSFSLIWKSRKS
ncbi:MAG TPA: DUF4277 domain-containing protein [Methanosarcinaceae archaeon]|nr:DUF4277 domain-containing protein [Methanosarcinaceae archaeon]